MPNLRSLVVSATGIAGVFACALVGTAQDSARAAPRIFTAHQAEAGRSLYAQKCASCHGSDFEGSGDAPPLAGSSFLQKWRTKMVTELFEEILHNMPATEPGSLSEGAALDATAYILQQNGGKAGSNALTAGEDTLVGAAAGGEEAKR